jgi:hypothetical protein
VRRGCRSRSPARSSHFINEMYEISHDVTENREHSKVGFVCLSVRRTDSTLKPCHAGCCPKNVPTVEATCMIFDTMGVTSDQANILNSL